VIPFDAITEWSLDRPWPTRDQVEQDLLLSRGIIAIASHPLLGAELTFRGGTALHKLHIRQPLRYSEDLDYVRVSSGGIQPITMALTELGEGIGFKVNSKMSQHPKIWWRTSSQTGSPMKIKIEINTHERAPALPLLEMACR